jgi:hypothetical protein
MTIGTAAAAATLAAAAAASMIAAAASARHMTFAASVAAKIASLTPNVKNYYGLARSFQKAGNREINKSM